MSMEAALSGITKTQSKTMAKPAGFDGIWRNQLKSHMDLKVAGQSVSGTYTSLVNVAGTDTEVTGQITGFANDDVIAFVVNWSLPSVSMTSWVGQVIENGAGKEELRTLWHLMRNIDEPDEPKKAWAAVLTGADVFTR